ncbi:hypothetical protein GGR53DRAFT_75428 [Hypoxylon sp. FL1150]|nr:hypothetical protein GGR53DRAFT_75428 [Hypoxylon sp. FL1150]
MRRQDGLHKLHKCSLKTVTWPRPREIPAHHAAWSLTPTNIIVFTSDRALPDERHASVKIEARLRNKFTTKVPAKAIYHLRTSLPSIRGWSAVTQAETPFFPYEAGISDQIPLPKRENGLVRLESINCITILTCQYHIAADSGSSLSWSRTPDHHSMTASSMSRYSVPAAIVGSRTSHPDSRLQRSVGSIHRNTQGRDWTAVVPRCGRP